ncbi:MAG: rhamnulokinase [Acidobacteria bacterium]|nr:rhamnulokinase [Acidobacteriota bacterium]
MAATRNCLVFDLGAESGRAVLGSFDGNKLTLEEIHRFPNGPVQVLDTLYWDSLRLFAEIKRGISAAIRGKSGGVDTLGIDTWGVDFGLLDRRGELLGNPYHYRDRRSDGMLEEAFSRVPRREIFERTGIQFMQINTLYQLLAMAIQESPVLLNARTLLMMPDLFNYWLTGKAVSERTIASTSQCLDPTTGNWASDLVERLGIPARIFPEVVAPGTILGDVAGSVVAETGSLPMRVVAGGCHDTASAVAAVPAQDSDYAYLSSGTWSLMGVEIPRPVINAKSLDYNFTNEGGVCSTIRLLKNIMGLWLIQECRRAWAAEGSPLTYEEIAHIASEAPAFAALVDPDHGEFLALGDMPARIRAFCLYSGQQPPGDIASTARSVFESLALKYRFVLERLEELVGRRLETIHIVGGGSQNRLLCQFTADATGRSVTAGPVEATAAGNALMQLMALGEIHSLQEGRELVRRSFTTELYEPRDTARWNEAYQRFTAILKQ